MAKPRIELQKTILDLVGPDVKVYFQPPSSTKITYPCVIYHLASSRSKLADNMKYHNYRRYDLKVVTKDPDSTIPALFENLDYCTLDRCYTADNLYHFAFTIYF